VQPADQPAPDTTAGDALREAIVTALVDMPIVRDYYTVPITPRDAHLLADALLSGPLAQLLADAAELRAKVQRVRELHHDNGGRGICVECSDDIAVGWPCATIEALNGEKP
jgi:hypothetical protein